MPSATAKRLSPEKPESWLLERIFPVWEIAALEPSNTMSASGSQLECCGAHLDGVADADGCRSSAHTRPGEERAVRGVEVLDDPGVAAQQQARVMAGGVVVADDEAGFAGAADRHRLSA